MKHRPAALVVLILLVTFAHQAGAWHDKTHLAVCRVAGHDLWFNCAAPDIAKLKAHSIEAYNHWFNNIAEVEVTPRMVLEQVERYNKANRRLDSEGHLPGAIIGALRAYKKDLQRGKSSGLLRPLHRRSHHAAAHDRLRWFQQKTSSGQ